MRLERMEPGTMGPDLTFSEWTSKEEDAADINVWEDNWDDDNVEDDFSVQLR